MRATLPLGRVAGVPVGLHWSVLGIVVLLVVVLSARLPVLLPGRDGVSYLLVAILAAGLFVLSLLAHEMAHAVVARRNRIKVDGVTLWLLGGVARLRGEALTPGAEFRIAAVGPATSLLVGVVFGVLAWLASVASVTALVVTVLAYLAWINVVLAGFNLIPAAPLDGGRILRSAVWAWRGDRLTATIWSTRAGRVLGFALIALGLVDAITGLTGATGGLWWVLIGLFVVTMAGAEEQQARTGAALAGTRVRDVMTPHPDTAHGDRTVAAFLHEVALHRRHSAFPLLDDAGRVQGLVTLNRLRAVPADRRDSTPLRDVACPPRDIPLAEPDEPLSGLLPRLGGCADGRALVMSDGVLVGIVSPSDVSHAVALRGLGVDLDSRGADVVHRPGT